jgi:hypothetical protein
LVLFPLWWLQRTHANPLSSSSSGGHTHGHHANSAHPGGDGGHRANDGGGGDGDDGGGGGGGGDGDDNGGGDGDDGGHDGDDGGGDHDDGGGDGDDDDGHDGDDDDDGGGITDCNHNGIDDSIDIANGTSQDVNHDGIPDECQSDVHDYCNGTGLANGGVDCPCGNTLPPGSPTGCANSSGTGASLTATGSAFISVDTLVLTVTNVPSGHAAYFLEGTVMNAGVTFGDGTRCIGGPIHRVSKVAHSSGHDSIPVPGGPTLSQQLGITAGQLTAFQVTYRDAAGPCHRGSNESNAIQVLWGP